MVFFRQGDSSIYNFSQVWVMVFHYDRISLKEGIGLETYEHCDEFIGNLFQKDATVIVYDSSLYQKQFNYK